MGLGERRWSRYYWGRKEVITQGMKLALSFNSLPLEGGGLGWG